MILRYWTLHVAWARRQAKTTISAVRNMLIVECANEKSCEDNLGFSFPFIVERSSDTRQIFPDKDCVSRQCEKDLTVG